MSTLSIFKMVSSGNVLVKLNWAHRIAGICLQHSRKTEIHYLLSQATFISDIW